MVAVAVDAAVAAAAAAAAAVGHMEGVDRKVAVLDCHCIHLVWVLGK